MNENQELDYDQFDVENDQICKDLAFEAKANDCGYHRLRERLGHGIGYTESTYKNSFACRD